MRYSSFELPGLVLFEPTAHADSRGAFFESFSDRDFREATGFTGTFVQDNHSVSHRNVLRGLHWQAPPHEQGKLVRVIAGAVFDVAVDIRPNSSSFGRWAGLDLSARNRRQLWIPPGFAHGFLALEDETEVLYKVTAYWDRASERALRWDDPRIGVDWPLDGSAPLLSEKDATAGSLNDLAVA